jgi:hypothetical protein
MRQIESASVSRGLDLFWNEDTEEGVQGMTELTATFRCQDLWWNEVLDEIRELRLSADNHAFLHGERTTVTGSWLGEG